MKFDCILSSNFFNVSFYLYRELFLLRRSIKSKKWQQPLSLLKVSICYNLDIYTCFTSSTMSK